MDTPRQQATRIFQAGVVAADPFEAVVQALRATPLAPVAGTTYVIALGKAAGRMAQAAMAELAGPARVLVVTNRENAAPLAGAELIAAGHPVPDENSLKAGHKVLEWLQKASAQDQVLALISGGGSALMVAPAPGLSLQDMAAVNAALLASGAEIGATNLVRQQLSRLKGGGMLAQAAPAPVRALILSDVVGDDLAAIASGPTVGPLGTRAQARDILRAHGIWAGLPEAVRTHLDSPAPDPGPLPKAQNRLIGSNRQSLAAMARAAPQAHTMPAPLTGDVAEAAARMLAWAAGPGTWLAGGETTVQLHGTGRVTGRGGRNQELALRVALLAEAAGWGPDWVFLSGGTDGRDGPTDAAGGLVDSGSLARMRARGVDPRAALAQNDSHTALAASGDLLITGATGTNVADLQVLIRG